jgi:tetratricopeptide (TPR) repeat protein
MGAGLIAAVALAGLAGGCGQQRSLDYVEKSGDKAFAAGDYAVAQKEYKEYVDRRPGKARVQHSLGMSYLQMGQAEAAVQCLSVAHDLEPANPEYTEDLARAYFKAGDRGKLYEYLHRLTQQPGTAADYVRLGEYAARLGDADEAQNALLTGAKIDGGRTVGPQIALADFYAGIGDKENALKRLRMALFIEPKNEVVAARIRELGEIPGPSYAITPEEAR